MKFEQIANVGDTIRSHDFLPMPGVDSVYVEGKVLAKGMNVDVGFACYEIEVSKDTTGRRIGMRVFVPMQVCFMEYDSRIVNLSAE